MRLRPGGKPRGCCSCRWSEAGMPASAGAHVGEPGLESEPEWPIHEARAGHLLAEPEPFRLTCQVRSTCGGEAKAPPASRSGNLRRRNGGLRTPSSRACPRTGCLNPHAGASRVPAGDPDAGHAAAPVAERLQLLALAPLVHAAHMPP